MKNDSWNIALRITANVTAWIAFPVIIALYLGKWLDQKFGTDPWLFIATTAFAFVVSMSGLITSTLQEFKKIDKESREKNKKDSVNNSSPAIK